MIGKARLDGGRFELIDTMSPPGLEDLSNTPAARKKLVVDLDSSGADDAKLRELYLKEVVATRAYNYFNGIYTFVDKDGFFYSAFRTSLIKFGHKDPKNPLSEIVIAGSLDMKTVLPADLAGEIKSMAAVALTGDGHIVIAATSTNKSAVGSIDIYFGPTALNGKERNWIKTVPGKGFFMYFRAYGPTQAFFDKTWKLNNVEKVK